MTKPHKHAEVLRAIADGVPLSEFEITWGAKELWVPMKEQLYTAFSDENSEIRRKPSTHTVNGFTVPAPLKSLKYGEQYFLLELIDGKPKAGTRHNNNEDLGARHCKSGVAYATQADAIANAKAMLKLAPETP